MELVKAYDGSSFSFETWALKKAALVIVSIFMAFLGAMALWALLANTTDNLHEVEPRALYRSAQLSGETLRSTIQKYDIRTVINLRGAHPGKAWYDDEMKVSDSLGVKHVDIKLSGNHKPTSKDMAQVYNALKDAPKPILIHCKGGIDRSGLVAAMYEYSFAGKPREEAEHQLSFYYGHFPWLWSRSDAMDIAFAQYASAPQQLIVGLE